MYSRYLLAFIIYSVLFTSCIPDEGVEPTLTFADVEMVLKGQYDGQPFVKNRAYAYEGGARVRFSQFNFFISDLLTSVTAEETFALDEIEYVDLALFEGEQAALSGYKLNVGRAPVAEYMGFSFGVGLTPDLNRSTPDEYGDNHPLGKDDRYDEDLNGFKFLTISGEVDYNSDNVYDESFNFVVAFDQNYKTITSTQNIEIIEEVTNIIEIEVDLLKILNNGIRSIDFSTQLNTSPNPSDEIMLLLNSNIAGAITVK